MLPMPDAGSQHVEGLLKARMKAAAKASATALADAAGAWADQDFRPQDELLEACDGGGLLLILRAPHRSAILFSEELRAAARLVHLPEHLLVPLGAGMWLLHGEADSAEAAALVKRLPQLCGVRLLLELCCCAEDCTSLLFTLSASPPARHHAPHWSLRYEQHFPASVMALAPWTPLALAPAVLIGLAGHFGRGFVTSPNEMTPAGGFDDFVLLETKPVLFLCRNRPIHRQRPVWLPLAEGPPHPAPPTDPVAPPSPRPASSSVEAMTSELGAVVLAAPLNTLSHPEADYGQPWWIQSWDTRPFAFSASLEPLVASAAVSIATSIHLASHPRASDGRPLRMLDPCCGSGTVLVAGLAHGHTCSGSDLREDFVTRAKENLEYMQLSLDGIAQHDALQPFPPGPIPDLIVCNPPWGKHIGAEEDGARIIASVVRQFGGATMCWVANATALATAIGIAGVELAYHCRVGGVEAFVLRTYRAE